MVGKPFCKLRKALAAGALSALVVCLMCAVTNATEEDAGAREPTRHWTGSVHEARRWIAYCVQLAGQYEITLPGKEEVKMQLLSEPVFRHGVSGHPDEWGVAFGPVMIWVDPRQRPVMIADLFVYPGQGFTRRMMFHEFHSLASEPISVERKADRPWRSTTKQAGTGWTALPSAPVPDDSAAARLRQMRQLSGRFHAHAFDQKHSRWEYRLIPRPIYRYEPKDDPVTLDGTVFLFCEGSDPEVVLLIEARRTPEGNRWYYALATLAGWEVHAELDNTEVWSRPIPPVRDPPGAVHFGNRWIDVRLPAEEAK